MDTQALEARLREANKLEALARFARGVAHDFNNVFTAVTANCDLLLEDIEPDDPRRPEVVAIREAIERATEMTRRLFKLGAVQPLESELVDLNDLVRTTEQELSAVAGDRIAVATALEPRFSPSTADPRELKQALLNLVLNARDAMPDGGKITIETANVVLDETYAADHRLMPQGHYALLAVTDTGTGMDSVRAVLHHPGWWRPQRARPRDGLRGGEKERRIRVGVQRAGTGHERENLLAPAAPPRPGARAPDARADHVAPGHRDNPPRRGRGRGACRGPAGASAPRLRRDRSRAPRGCPRARRHLPSRGSAADGYRDAGRGGPGARRAIHRPATRDPRAVHVRLSGGGHRAASNARAGARVSAEAVQRRGAGAEGPRGAGVEATAGGGAAGSGREPTILIFVPHN